MNFRSYAWLALVVFLLGVAVLHQGWNHSALELGDGCGTMKTQEPSPAAGHMNNMSGSGQK